MQILSHRGLWKNDTEKNTLNALIESLSNGFGFESDIRDYLGKIVISHNPADENSCQLDDVFNELMKYKDKYCFAINVKADGLTEKLKQLLEKYEINNYFCFDMSVPQMIEYKKDGIIFFTRRSEYEQEPLMLYEQASGVWLDAFENDEWIDEKLISKYLNDGKKVCIVSPELHQRPYLKFWKRLKSSNINLDKIILCTDVPLKAKEYFEGD